jgi:hypothetical protein
MPELNREIGLELVKRQSQSVVGLDAARPIAPDNWVIKHKKHSSEKWEPTTLDPNEEQQFRQWMSGTQLYNSIKSQIAKENGVPLGKLDDSRVMDMITNNPQGDYDYRAAWKNGITESISPHDGLPHWPSRAQNGAYLKSPQHPTAWKEFFMQQHQADPDSLGLENYEDAVKWSAQ